MVLFSISAKATAPKQICKVEKDLKVLFFNMSVQPEVEAEITYNYYVNMTGAAERETKTVLLATQVSIQNENLLVASGKFQDSFSNSLYVKGLKSVATKYFVTLNGEKSLVYEEIESPEVYYQGQEVPMGSLVCFEYAN